MWFKGGRAWSRLLFVLGVLFFPTRGWGIDVSSSLVVEIPSALAVRRGTLYLGEIARLTGPPTLVSRASKARLLFREEGWTAQDFWRALGEAGLVGETVELRMAPRTILLSEDTVTMEVRRLSRWPWGLSVMAEGNPCGVLTSPSELAFGIRATVFRFRSPGGAECVVPVRIRWLVPGAVTLRTLERGMVLNPEDFRIALREWEGSVPPGDPLVWAGQLLEKDLPEGALLRPGDVRAALAVRRGDAVRLVYVTKGLHVEAWGTALQRGVVGDIIRVRNTLSRAVVSGVITAQGTVLVERK